MIRSETQIKILLSMKMEMKRWNALIRGEGSWNIIKKWSGGEILPFAFLSVVGILESTFYMFSRQIKKIK